MKKISPRLSIVIVSHNTLGLTRACIDSIRNARRNEDHWKIYIVDNASNDGSLEYLRSIPSARGIEFNIIQNSENLGFAKANNQVLSQIVTPYVLLLNSDTELPVEGIHSLFRHFDRSEVGAVTGKLLLPDGTMDLASHRGIPTPWASLCYFLGLERMFPKVPLFSGYHQLNKDLDSVHTIPVCSGAFLLLRSEVIESVGLLDEQFFMYGEDVDYAYRMQHQGWSIIYDPGVTILHNKKQSGRNSNNPEVRKRITYAFYQTMWQFYAKHFIHVYPRFITWLIHMLIWLRLKTLGV